VRCEDKNFLKGRKMKTTKSKIRCSGILAILVLAMGPVVWSGQATSPGSIVCWGANAYGQAAPPTGNDFVAIAAGEYHSLALKSDGSIVGWGDNRFGQATPPVGSDFEAIVAGHGHSLALKSDGSIVGWGLDTHGQATPPTENDFVAIAGGMHHSLALKSDGSIVGWGYDNAGQATPPTDKDFVAIAARHSHSLALKSDGSIVVWGYNVIGEVPPDNDFVAIAAGYLHGLALKSDGSIVGWGFNGEGQATPPLGNDFVAIAAGENHSLALKSDGSIVGWGSNDRGAATPPLGSDFVAIAGGGYHSLAIKAADKDWIVSGDNMYSEPTCNVGIGTTNPAEKLEVSGNVKISGLGNGLIFSDGTKLESQPVGDGGPDDDWMVSGDNMYSEPTGNVGIGTTGPAEKLEVSGNVKISGSGSGLIFPDGTRQITAAGAGGDGDDAWTVSGDNMYSIPSGNVGIGTTSPADKLHVSGGNIRLDYTSGIDIIQQNGSVSGIDPSRNDLNLRNSATGDIKFLTGTLPNITHPRLLIANDGNVGIGTTSPGEKLDVAGAANLNKDISTGIALRVNGAEALWYNGVYFSWGFGGTANFFADGIGIGVVDPGPHKLYVNGTGYATGGFWASDLRFKKNIKAIDSPVDKINNVRGISFEWKRSEYKDKGFPEGEHYGVIAQEVEQVLPEIVKEGPDGDKAVSYTELVPILTEGIKEQQKQLERQQRQIECLLQRIESLERFVQQQQFAVARQVQ
jgi:hypothetical protein